MKKNICRLIICVLVSSAAVSMSGCGAKRRQEEYKRAGIEAMQEEDYGKALKSFENALSQSGSVHKEEKDIALYKASAQYRLGKTDDAVTTLKGLLAFDDKDIKAMYLLGLIYCDTGDADKALSYLTKACGLSGKASLYENAYLSLINSGMQDEADSFYDGMPKEARASKKVLRLRVVSFEADADFTNAYDSVKSYLAQYPDDEEMAAERDFLKTVTENN